MSNWHQGPGPGLPVRARGRTRGGRPRPAHLRRPSLEHLDERVLLSVGFDPVSRTFTATGSNTLLLAQVDQGGTEYLAYNETADDPNNLQVTAVAITAG